jgi:hypothetical protein
MTALVKVPPRRVRALIGLSTTAVEIMTGAVGIILDWLGINASCFMFLYGVVLVPLILNTMTEVRRLHTSRGVSSRHSRNALAYFIPGLKPKEDRSGRADGGSVTPIPQTLLAIAKIIE